MTKQIIFVDSSVQDYQSLVQSAEGGKVVILDDKSSKIAQITQSLAGESDIEALHIISHGNEGSITLGTEVLDESAIETFRDRLKQWGKALTKTGDILLYGCNVAAGEVGKKFVKKLSEITGAAVAASNNLTGAAALGGDWSLEVRFGEIETQPLNFANYGYTLPATITNVTSTAPNGNYVAGQTIPITVTFSEPVNVSFAPGFPGFNLNSGGVAIYASGAGTNTLLFNYTITGGQVAANLDYSSTSLNGTITTASDNSPATLTLPVTGGALDSLGDNKAFVIADAVPPTITSVTAPAAATYKLGDTLDFVATFSEPVTVTAGATLPITLDSGGVTAVLVGSGALSATQTFRYTVVAPNLDTAGGIAVGTALTGTITDGAANAVANPTFTAPVTPTVNVDGVVPTITSVTGPITPGTGTPTTTYLAGNVLDFTATFLEPVTIIGGANLPITLDTGGTVNATLTSGGASSATHTFGYTVVAGNADTNGIGVGTALTLPTGATVKDAAGNDATLTFTPPATPTINVDAVVPTVTSIVRKTPTTESIPGTTTAVTYTVTFSEQVSGLDPADFTVTSVGGVTNTGVVVSAPTASNSVDVTVNGIAGGDGTIRLDLAAAPTALVDNAGNAVATPFNTGDTYTRDATPPILQSVTSTTATGSYSNLAAAPDINVTLTFSEPVTSTSAITVALNNGGTVTIPAFATAAASVSGTYTPPDGATPGVAGAGDIPLLDLFATTPINLVGGLATLTDAAGNAITSLTPTTVSLAANNITVDTKEPTLTLTTAAVAPVTGLFSVTATFDETVGTTFDDTDVTLGNGSISNFVPSATTPGLYTFDVTPTNDGPVTIDVAASKATDAALNPNTAAQLLVNANVPPKVTSISSTSPDGSYGTGKVIPITVTFTEPVVVTGSPTIALNSGGTATYRTVGGGSGTNTLTFDYTVAAGQTIADLDYSAIAALTLNGGTINDATVTTSAAILDLPALGAANSLGVNKNLVIDTTPPNVTINQASSQVDPTSNTLINYTVVFDQEVTGFDATDITFTGITGAAATVTGDGTGQNYNVAVTGLTQPGALTATIAANAANDLAGNGNTVSTSTDNSVTFNPVTPYVTAINKLDPDPTAATTVNYQVTFNESVTGVDAADFTLVTNGVTGATIGAITGSGTTYNVPVNTGTLDGTVQLDLVDNNSILNALNAPLGGAAPNDGNFKGQVYTVGKNSAPVVAVAINDQSATIDTGFTFTIPTGTFTDPNNDPLTYTATLEGGTPLPTWLTFDAATGIFSGTPATANIGNLKVNVAASDGQAFTTNTFLLTVSDKLNTPPVVAVALNDTSATINTAFSFTVPTTTFTDAENDPLTYTATLEDGTALPGWLTFDATTGVFSGTPAAANVGNLKVKLTANDGKASTGNTFILTVSDQLNTPPVVASATIDKSTTSGAVFSFTVPAGTFTDAENDPLTYTATQENGTALPTWLAFDAATQTFSGTPAAANVGNLKVKLTANDGKASTSDFFQLVVNAAPTPPQTPGQGSSPTPLPIPTPAPSPGPSPTPTPARTLVINTPPISLIGRGEPTGFPQNQVVDGQYLLTDGDDTSIPSSAFGKPIFALSGNDNLTGSSGNDTILGNQGADIINGADGNDSLFGGKESDQLSGGNGNDFLSGNNDNDTLTGGAGNDLLRGGKENDVLLGGDGDDELWGDRGFDALTGGGGRDTFVLQYTDTNPSQADVITDFNSSEDKIRLVGFSFSQLTFESVNVVLDGATALASTAIKSGNDYLGVVYNVNQSALNSGSFL
ncbi:DUF4347 domain-containing protein [Tychonema sp. LEGE 06208]|uniref:DUF4347 domain-containing protein n=2 Tax=Microcoleaceae TaxID=1892252 RepID=UPI001D149CA2|nr:DUF4347 domain-containing protein [Tychonema sp. LEGE 06208]